MSEPEDIVDRLRKRIGWYLTETTEVIRDAVSEIEQLRQDCDRLRALVPPKVLAREAKEVFARTDNGLEAIMGHALRGKRASSKAKKTVAASALAQDETKGQGKKTRKKASKKKARKKG